LHTAQLMSLPLTVSCFSKIQIGFTFLVPAHPGSPGQRAVKRVFMCVWRRHRLYWHRESQSERHWRSKGHSICTCGWEKILPNSSCLQVSLVVCSVQILAIVPDSGATYCDERVCLSVCLCVCLSAIISVDYTSDLHQVLCASYAWPWLSPPLAA